MPRINWLETSEHPSGPRYRSSEPSMTFCRTAARNLRRSGISETVIMKIGGWRPRSVFERYAIVNRNDMADAILRLERKESRSTMVTKWSRWQHNTCRHHLQRCHASSAKHKCISKLGWCREGESNPQGPKPGGF
jgi:hypothetical protein